MDTQVPVKTQVYMNLNKTLVQEEWFTRVVVSFQGWPLSFIRIKEFQVDAGESGESLWVK